MVSPENVIFRLDDWLDDWLDLGVLSIASHLAQFCSTQQLLDGASYGYGSKIRFGMVPRLRIARFASTGINECSLENECFFHMKSQEDRGARR